MAFLAIASLPLLLLGFGVRREMTTRLDREAAARTARASTLVASRVAALLAATHSRLSSLASGLAGDNRFRIGAANDESPEHRWVLDWASSMMQASGLSVLQLQDSAGRILSAGHFRNDYDRSAPGVVRAIAQDSLHAAVLDTRMPDRTQRALVTSAPFTVRGATYAVVGGVDFDSVAVAALSPDAQVASMLVIGADVLPNSVRSMALPYIDDAARTTSSVATSHLVLLPDDAPTRALKAGVTRWVVITLGATLLLAGVVATLLSRVIAAPLVALSEQTARLDLDRLDQRFASGRRDELGALERTLDALTGRLRASVSRLRHAERAAATGDLARQVNHDIKNGLAPIRNVLRHLAQVAEREPAALPTIFAERRETLESSVEYLDALARNYARLSPALERGRTDPRPVVLAVARGVTEIAVKTDVPDVLPAVRADAVVLQRILDNLVSNAVDAVAGTTGEVSISASTLGTRVRFVVADSGSGMTREALDLAFSDFHTTKQHGTGLGLSVVRRLLADVGGTMRAETAPGEGTTFTIEIPVA